MLLPDLVQDLEKQIAPACRSQELLATITTTRDKVPLTAGVKAAQSFRLERILIPPFPSPPQKARAFSGKG
jgi:hypothetical protein